MPSTTPSQKLTSVHSLVPQLIKYNDPSKELSNKTSRLPYVVPPDEHCENPSSYPSVLSSMYPPAEHSVDPISVPYYIPSVYNQPSPCTVCTDNLTPTMVAHNENCQTSNYWLSISCGKDEWKTNNYCELRCLQIGLGCTSCCPITENPSSILSNVPSKSPYISPSVMPKNPPSQKIRSVHSLAPRLITSTEPSKAPRN